MKKWNQKFKILIPQLFAQNYCAHPCKILKRSDQNNLTTPDAGRRTPDAGRRMTDDGRLGIGWASLTMSAAELKIEMNIVLRLCVVIVWDWWMNTLILQRECFGPHILTLTSWPAKCILGPVFTMMAMADYFTWFCTLCPTVYSLCYGSPKSPCPEWWLYRLKR